jgi:hypothetical protein
MRSGVSWEHSDTLAGLSSFTLRSAKKILALDVIGSKSAHVSFVLPFPSLLHGL